ncbi:P-loop containing nucleoside triphosphate hydrolase protein [Haematococcus lacustris]
MHKTLVPATGNVDTSCFWIADTSGTHIRNRTQLTVHHSTSWLDSYGGRKSAHFEEIGHGVTRHELHAVRVQGQAISRTTTLSCCATDQVPTRGSGDAPAAPAKHSFTFDKVFGPASTQAEVFEEISELVQSALDGHKVCIFAYGQTGSGKTHTMLGTAANPGMIPLAMHQVFDTSRKLGSQGWTFNMAASMLEIYNEEYKDLLCKTKKDDRKHQVQHNADGTTLVTDMVVIDVSTAAKVVDSLLSDAMDKRTVGCTQLNEHSSRSHMVFMLRIDGVNTATGQVIAGSLNLIDLAGSERVKESGASGQQMKEAQSINKSLSALGDVIVAIANKEKHIPYRNSKLTYLLQPCLGGDAKTLMFVNIAPSKEFAPESLCSLRFAAKVNACEINPKRQGAARQ